MRNFWVYIMASGYNGTLYVGVTSNLEKRIHEHKNEITKGFTTEHDVKTLVYFEQHESAEPAIIREKLIKRWKREWKMNLIEQQNPHWEDLSLNWYTPNPKGGSLPAQG